MPGLVQIVTPPSSSALTTLITAKTDLNQTDSYGDDNYITGLIDRASSIVATHCGRTFGKQTVSETFRMTGRNSNSYLQAVATYGTPLAPSMYNPIMLTYLPIISITSVVEGGVTLTTADYEYDADTGSVWRVFSGIRSAWMSLSTVVTYVAGYVLPSDTGTRTLPGAIEEVALSLVRGAYFARGGDPRVVMEIVDGVGRNNYSLKANMSGMEIDSNSDGILSNYKTRIW